MTHHERCTITETCAQGDTFQCDLYAGHALDCFSDEPCEHLYSATFRAMPAKREADTSTGLIALDLLATEHANLTHYHVSDRLPASICDGCSRMYRVGEEIRSILIAQQILPQLFGAIASKIEESDDICAAIKIASRRITDATINALGEIATD